MTVGKPDHRSGPREALRRQQRLIPHEIQARLRVDDQRDEFLADGGRGHHPEAVLC